MGAYREDHTVPGQTGESQAVLSLIVGSVSAGLIYAAFPMCIMLYKKGASIRNLIIILSSWAVIKVPMLLNETKFLGPKFMLIHWVVTIMAIVIFLWIAEKFISDDDLPGHAQNSDCQFFPDSCLV